MSETEAPVPRPPQITAAIIAAMKAVRAVGKNGFNEDQRFKYRKYDDIVTVANEALVEAGIAITATTVAMEREQRVVTTKSQSRRTVTTTVVHMQYTLTCAADASAVTVDWYGEASDYGDKSLGKALSYSAKMFLIDLLKIPVDDPDADADGASHAEDAPEGGTERQGQRARAPRQPRSNAARRGASQPKLADAPPVPAPPAESDDELHADMIIRLDALDEDPEAEGGRAALEKIWNEIERARIERNAWAVDDYNRLKARVREMNARITDAENARAARAAAQMTAARPDPAEDDPWADAPTAAELRAQREAAEAEEKGAPSDAAATA